jgi:hypothetical protein
LLVAGARLAARDAQQGKRDGCSGGHFAGYICSTPGWVKAAKQG